MVISPEKELVSIIMPNYNGSLNLKETILSVISQTYTNWELIIVDDNSSDNSIEIINEFMERIHVFYYLKIKKMRVQQNLEMLRYLRLKVNILHF